MRTFLAILATAAAIALLLFIVGCAPAPYETLPEALGLPEESILSVNEGHVTLAGDGHTFAFMVGARPATIDGIRYHLHRPAGEETLDAADIDLLRAALLQPAPRVNRPVILLDPGHGGADIGCSAGKDQEHAIAHDIAQHAAALLRAAGCEVRLTRAADQGLSLQARVDQATSAPPDAYVSIHVNAAANPGAKGIEVFTLPAPGCDGTPDNSRAASWPAVLPGQPHLVQSTRLALRVQASLLRLPGTPADRGVKHAYFKVLREVPAPAILVETGFITNPEDRARLASPEGRQNLGFAIALGVLDAFAR